MKKADKTRRTSDLQRARERRTRCHPGPGGPPRACSPEAPYAPAMPGDLNYAHEKFSKTREWLAEGWDDLRGRLAYSWEEVDRTNPLQDGLGPEIDEQLDARIDALHDPSSAEQT